MCTSLLINYTTQSFAILADESSMNDTANLPTIGNNKIKSIYHQNCIIPNEDFSILYNSIASKLQQSGLLEKNLYSSKDFFNKVSSKLRDLKPKSDTLKTHVDQLKDQKMERPMFITTVKTGTFLEPPPEVAALLGLRKNSYGSNTGSSTSSTGKAQNAGNGNVIYSFASKPRILKSNLQSNVASRSLFRSENKQEKREIFNELPKISNDTSDGTPQYGNTMYDRRVARGSNFASQRPNVISTEHILSRQAEARRRAAVRQRAQIRARKLRSGTPPPVDGRRHGQIQTDKYLEELTERPSDKSIACQADLAVEHNSPIPYHTSTGVDAETQIYTGDLPDFDNEIPSVVTSIVNKILQEAILEINDEIQVIRLQNIASEKRARANTLTKEDNGIITKNQLNGLLQQAIDQLKTSEFNSTTHKNLDQLDTNQLLEKIFAEIKNQIFDVKFLTGIIKTQLENWPEPIQTNELDDESNKPENPSDRDEYDNASNAEGNDNAEVTDFRKEPLSTVDPEDYSNDEENEAVDEDMEQENVENNDYKTDDFEEENKDLMEEKYNDNDEELTSTVLENSANAENENPSVLPENTDNTSQQDENTVDNNEEIESNPIEDDNEKTETVVEQNENFNDNNPETTTDQTTTQVPIIIESANETQLNVNEKQENIDEDNLEENNPTNSPDDKNVSNTANQSEETSKHEITDDKDDNPASTNNEDKSSNNLNIEEIEAESAPEPVPQNVNESTKEDVVSLLDPTVNDTPEHDIVITSEEFANNNEENSLNEIPEAINKSENGSTEQNVVSLLDPPVQDIANDDKEDATVIEEADGLDVKDSNEDDNNSGTTKEANNDNETDEQISASKNDENEANDSSINLESDNRPNEVTDTESVSTNEDDNDVIAVKPNSPEPPAITTSVNDSEGQPTSGVIPDEVQDTLINEMPDDSTSTDPETARNTDTYPRRKTKPITDNDNISDTSSLSTNRSRETLNVKISDSESVENNELQSSYDGTIREDPDAQANSRAEETEQQNIAAEENTEPAKPLNTENIAEETSNKLDSINDNPIDDSQPEPTDKHATDPSNNNTESTESPEYGPTNDPNDQDVSEVRHHDEQVNDITVQKEEDTSEPPNQRIHSAESKDGTSDTNNNDTTKHPTISVQNGSAVANR